jgi:hypothetical protein
MEFDAAIIASCPFLPLIRSTSYDFIDRNDSPLTPIKTTPISPTPDRYIFVYYNTYVHHTHPYVRPLTHPHHHTHKCITPLSPTLSCAWTTTRRIDKAAFTFGVLNLTVSEFVLVRFPQASEQEIRRTYM